MLTRRRLRTLLDPWAIARGRRKAHGLAKTGLLIVQAGGMGDSLLFQPFLERFRPLARPGETVTLLLRQDAAKMAFLYPDDVAILALDFTRLLTDLAYRMRTLAEIRARNMRAVLSVDWRRHAYLDDALIRACEASEILGFAPKPWPKYQGLLDANARRFTRLVTLPRPMPMMSRWSHLAHELTGVAAPLPKVGLPTRWLVAPEPLARPVILIQPFASSRDRQPRPEFWLRLMAAFPDRDFVLIPGPDDLARNPDYRVLLERARLDIRRFPDLIALLRAAKLVVCVDSAVMHLAQAAGAPTLGLATAAYLGEVTPYEPEADPGNAHPLWVPMPCQGCVGDCRRPFVGEQYECVSRLDPETAIAKMRELLG